ncbi:YdgA family protein [Gallibacterium trehalosifermentans]|uniref:YdgA family protein n=1 Tax=Gallibacterium trehalosifermentans TaxID=516935 RepID=A0ABV6H2C0_9PAST
MMQKKLAIIPATILVLGGIWIGGAWYTGKQIEQIYPEEVAAINQNPLIQLENIKFQRHIFSSEMQYDVKMGDKSFPVQSHIYHGPLPTNLLSQSSFQPLMASVETTLIKNEQTEPFFKLFSKAQPFLLTTNVDYQQQLNLNLAISSGKLQTEKGQANWSDSQYQLTLDKEKNIHYQATLNHLDLNIITDQRNELPSKILIEEFATQGDLQLTQWKYLPVGKGTSKVKRLQIEQLLKKEGNQTFSITYENQISHEESSKDGDFFSIKSEGTIDNVLINQQSLYAQKAKFELNHLQGEAFQKIVEAALENDQAKLGKALQTIFTNQPQFIIAPLALHNANGQFALNSHIQLGQMDFKQALDKGKLEDIFNQLRLSLVLDKAFQQQFITGIIKMLYTQQAEKTISDQDVENIQTGIQRLLQEQVVRGILTETETSYEFNFEQKDKKFYLNQQEIPKEVLFFALLQLVTGF